MFINIYSYHEVMDSLCAIIGTEIFAFCGADSMCWRLSQLQEKGREEDDKIR